MLARRPAPDQPAFLLGSGAVSLRCTNCGYPLQVDAATRPERDEVPCGSCGRRFPRCCGILDLRTRVQETCWTAARTIDETALVDRMAARFARASLLDLIDEYVSAHRLPRALLVSMRDYSREAEKRETWTVRYMDFSLRRYAGRALGGRLALDAGCGSGGSLSHLAASSANVIGVDVDLPSLVLAAKRCEEMGIRDRVTLVAARLEDPAFLPGTFDQIKCTDVIEHVDSVEDACRELTAALVPGGAMFVLTPNKWSFVTPEPHVRLWGVQFLPIHIADWYVERRIGIRYLTVARLMGYRRFMRALRSSGAVEVTFVPVEDKHLNPDSRRGRAGKRMLNAWPAAAVSRAMRPVQPSLEAICVKVVGTQE
jgi:2-polyprenyl-3-methyl-5-hydroxy-6-metoxy-1,4-benzoquinol methylase